MFKFYRCIAGLACAPLTSEDLQENTIRFSMSRAWLLGNAVKLARKEKRCPVKAVLESQNGKLLISGKVHKSYILFDRLKFYETYTKFDQ